MRIAVFVLFSILLYSCSSTPSRPLFSDYMEVREIRSDDLLASRFRDTEGEEYRLGDPVIMGKSVSRLQVKRVSDDRYDLYVTLLGVDDARWRRFSRSRGRQAALVVDGVIRSVFDVQNPGTPVEGEVLIVPIPNVASSEIDAEKLDRFLEDNRPAKRKAAEEL